MKKFAIGAAIVGALILLLMVGSCIDRPAPVAQIVQPVSPQVVQAAPVAAPPVIVQQSSSDGFFQGMLVGHLFSSGPTVIHHYDSRPAYVAPRTTTIVNNTTVVNRSTTVRATPTPPSRPSYSYSAPRATSYSGSYSSRPSYSSYSSRSSYSGFSSSRR